MSVCKPFLTRIPGLLEKLNRRLMELNEEKNQFLGIAFHDLKNLLASIGLVGELLMTGGLMPEEVVEMRRHIALRPSEPGS